MLTELVGREWVLAGFRFLNQFIKKATDGTLMDELVNFDFSHLCLKFSTSQRTVLVIDELLIGLLILFRPHTEELVELEYLIILNSFITYHLGKSEGENLHTGQLCIRIRIAKMLVVPFLLGTLLHYIVPCINLALVVLVEQVERCARQRQNACIFFLQFRHHTYTSCSFDTFMCFINHHKIPIILHDSLFQRIKVALLATDVLRET